MISEIHDDNIKMQPNSPMIKNIISILEEYIRSKKLLCHGGIAINNLMPKSDKIYDLNREIPDYDVLSPNNKVNIKELVEKFKYYGFNNIYVKLSKKQIPTIIINNTEIVDICEVNSDIFKKLSKNAIKVNGILNVPVSYIYIDMYRQLSSATEIDMVKREKITKRYMLLNKHYPTKNITNISNIGNITKMDLSSPPAFSGFFNNNNCIYEKYPNGAESQIARTMKKLEEYLL